MLNLKCQVFSFCVGICGRSGTMLRSSGAEDLEFDSESIRLCSGTCDSGFRVL